MMFSRLMLTLTRFEYIQGSSFQPSLDLTRRLGSTTVGPPIGYATQTSHHQLS